MSGGGAVGAADGLVSRFAPRCIQQALSDFAYAPRAEIPGGERLISWKRDLLVESFEAGLAGLGHDEDSVARSRARLARSSALVDGGRRLLLLENPLYQATAKCCRPIGCDREPRCCQAQSRCAGTLLSATRMSSSCAIS